MNITLQRISVKGEITEGHLRIDGLTICDTLENTYSCLAPGDYRVHIIKCRQYARKMPILSPVINNQSSVISICSSCPRKLHIGINTKLPRVCPMLKPGNGVYNRTDGAIIVGEYLVPGCLKHPKTAFANLFDRIRKNIERGSDITLTIR